MTTITFVRHGNTAFNVEKRAQGHLHNPLNDTGRKQAASVAKRLAEESWDFLISSDLWRARETAEIISAALGRPVDFFDTRLREIGRGQMEGTIVEERIQRWGEDWRQLDLGEESKQSVRERGISFVNDMAERYPGKKLLVVSHGLLLKLTLKGLTPDEPALDNLHNASVTTIARNGEKWEYIRYNCTQHLTDASITL